MNSRQLRKIATNPRAMMRFQATGKPPEMWNPDSPLTRLLENMSVRERLQMRAVRLNTGLGYTGDHLFHNAEQLLKWLKPPGGLVEGESCPAESRRIKSFRQQLTLNDLIDATQHVPAEIEKRRR